jgi:hypothetical protein
VQIDLPRLAQRVCLDEVTLVVDMKAVVSGMVLEVGDKAGDVDDRHIHTSLPRLGPDSCLDATRTATIA